MLCRVMGGSARLFHGRFRNLIAAAISRTKTMVVV
jgi:hypothetical protein